MLPGSLQALVVLGIAVAPGFLCTTAWARAKTWKGPEGDLRTLLHSIVLSAVVQVVVSPLTIFWIYPEREVLEQFPERVAIWLALVVVVVPMVGGVAVGRLTDYLSAVRETEPRGWKSWLAKIKPAAASPSVWDWLFTTNPPDGRFLLIELDDGSRVAGVFAEGSMALTSPEPQGVFLISEWLVDDDGDITGERPDTLGILVPDIHRVRTVRVLKERQDGE